MTNASNLNYESLVELKKNPRARKMVNSVLEDFARLLELKEEMVDNQFTGCERSNRRPSEIYKEAEKIACKYPKECRKFYAVLNECRELAR